MAMKLGRDTGSLVNHLYSNMVGGPEPKIGEGATILCWSDRHAGTITAIYKDGFDVRVDRATRTDGNALSESQNYEYTPDPKGELHQFRTVKRGRSKGQFREGGRADGNGVIIGKREKYRDPSF